MHLGELIISAKRGLHKLTLTSQVRDTLITLKFLKVQGLLTYHITPNGLVWSPMVRFCLVWSYIVGIDPLMVSQGPFWSLLALHNLFDQPRSYMVMYAQPWSFMELTDPILGPQ